MLILNTLPLQLCLGFSKFFHVTGDRFVQRRRGCCAGPSMCLCNGWGADLTPSSCPDCQRAKGQNEPRVCRSHTGNYFLDWFLLQWLSRTWCCYVDSTMRLYRCSLVYMGKSLHDPTVALCHNWGFHFFSAPKTYLINVHKWLQYIYLIRLAIQYSIQSYLNSWVILITSRLNFPESRRSYLLIQSQAGVNQTTKTTLVL